MFGIRKRAAIPLLAISLYVVVGAGFAIGLRSVHPYDFMMAYKFLWYLLLLIPFSGRPVLDANQLARLLRICLVSFCAVYLGKVLIGNSRPTFFTENNFEILLICLLFISAQIANDGVKFLDIGLLLAVAVLSGSRSGAALAALVVLLSFDYRKLKSGSALLVLFGGVAAVFAMAYVFMTRTSGGIESIDRYNFLLGLLEATKGWSFFDFMVGAPRVSALPPIVCSRLSFYEALFSYSGDGTCYSVVLHSFVMRILFDHGVIVMVAVGALIWSLLKGANWRSKAGVLMLLVANGLSVSSINSVYAALGLVVACSAASYARAKNGRDSS